MIPTTAAASGPAVNGSAVDDDELSPLFDTVDAAIEWLRADEQPCAVLMLVAAPYPEWVRVGEAVLRKRRSDE